MKPTGGPGLWVGFPQSIPVPRADCSAVPGFPEVFSQQAARNQRCQRQEPYLWPVWGCRGFWTVGGEGPPKLHLAAHEAAHGRECQAAGTGLTSLPPSAGITVPSTPGPGQGPPDHKTDGGNGFPRSSSPLAGVSELFPARPLPRSAGLADRGAPGLRRALAASSMQPCGRDRPASGAAGVGTDAQRCPPAPEPCTRHRTRWSHLPITSD